MSKTVISPGIIKRKKILCFYYHNHTKKLDFVKEAEKRQKKLPGKFLRANMHTANI